MCTRVNGIRRFAFQANVIRGNRSRENGHTAKRTKFAKCKCNNNVKRGNVTRVNVTQENVNRKNVTLGNVTLGNMIRGNSPWGNGPRGNENTGSCMIPQNRLLDQSLKINVL
jgi:hypothetical protein